MGSSNETKEFEMPLHMQLALRRAELQAKELTWDQLVTALLELYRQRLMEIQTIKDMLQEEAIELEFDIPSDVELVQLAMTAMLEEDTEEGEEEHPF
ncbi:MAG TPA: hypothetical protein DCM40_37765 [Maribacter sp.]|mgnify:CR=1 FL=1|nr:MAG: hypothetical protein Tp158DCM1229571_43 [Prokaryotic dsDNA virus sp.]HAI43444.1 hypothetical protein [Maribacter sp.]|tara:strand:- start:380 stop:670 length:291 start_codon:yes stop_codon:yes gene_type:complete